MVETSISAEHLATQLETLFAAGGGPPRVLQQAAARSARARQIKWLKQGARRVCRLGLTRGSVA